MDRIPRLRSRSSASSGWVRRPTAVVAGVLAVLLVASLSADARVHKSAPTPPAEPIPTRLHFFEMRWANCDEPEKDESCNDHGLHPMGDPAIAVGATLERADTGEPVFDVRVDFYRDTGEGICFGLTQESRPGPLDGLNADPTPEPVAVVHCEATHDLAGISADNRFVAVFEGNGKYGRSTAHYTMLPEREQLDDSSIPS